MEGGVSALLETLRGPPVNCNGIHPVLDSVSSALNDGLLDGPTCSACCQHQQASRASNSRHSNFSCAAHFIVNVPIVLQHGIAVELFFESSSSGGDDEEPDFIVSPLSSDSAAAAAVTDVGGVAVVPAASPPPPQAQYNTSAGMSAAVLPKSWRCVEDYSWLQQSAKPKWNPNNPDRLLNFIGWIKAGYEKRQRDMFTETVLAINERLQFEYASYLQGIDEHHFEVFVQRHEPGSSLSSMSAASNAALGTGGSADHDGISATEDSFFVVSVVITLCHSSAEARRQWRQLLFRTATTIMQFNSPDERIELIDCLEDFEAVEPPVHVKYVSMLVLHDSSPSSFRVTKEAIITEVDTLIAAAGSPNFYRTLLRLKTAIDAVVPFGKCEAKLANGPASYIDIIPHLEDEILNHWAMEQYVWWDTAQCLAELMGPPVVFESSFFGAASHQQRFAVFTILDDLSRLTLFVQVIFFSRKRLPLMTISSAQFCLKNGTEAIRVQATVDERKVMKRCATDGSMHVNPVAVQEELEAFLVRLMPKLQRVCGQHVIAS